MGLKNKHTPIAMKKHKRGFGTIRYEQRGVVWVRIEHGTSWTRFQKFTKKIVSFLISLARHDAYNTVHGERLKIVETESVQPTLYLKINLLNRWVGSGVKTLVNTLVFTSKPHD